MAKVFCLFILIVNVAYGESQVIGRVFPIKEKDIRDLIQSPSKNDPSQYTPEGSQGNASPTSSWHPSLTYPARVHEQLTRNRVHYYRPAYTFERDVKTPSGELIVKKGTIVKPLDKHHLSRPLLFFSGSQQVQIDFVHDYLKHHTAKLIMTDGNYQKTIKRICQRLYVDQFSSLQQKLGIAALPAIVEQQGSRLRITEYAL